MASTVPPGGLPGRPRRQRLGVLTALLGLLAAILTGSAHGLLTDTIGVGSNTFATAGCFSGAAVDTVQKGTATNNANGTQTVTITAVDTSRAFLTFTARHGSNLPTASLVRGQLASSTTVEFVRNTSEPTPADIVISWTVVEYRCGVKVQRGTVAHTATSIDVTLGAAVASTAQAFVLWSKSSGTGDSTFDENDHVVVDLTSTSNLQVRSTATNTAHTIAWQVVEFTNATAVNVQRASLSMTTVQTSVATTLASAVDLSRTITIASVQADTGSSTSNVGASLVRAVLTSTTQVTVTREVTSSLPIPEIAVQVVEFREGTLVTTGSLTLGAGTASGTGTLVGVDSGRASGWASTQAGAGNGSGSTAYTTDDVPGVASATVVVTNASTVTLTRSSTAAAATFVWQVIEWGGPSWWDTAWQQRYPIVVRTTSSALPSSYSVSFAFDHAALVAAGDSLASGNDVRVAQYDGATWTELDRYLDASSSWNGATTTLWVRLPVTMTTNSSYSRLFLYVTNPAAGSPPANGSNVFQFYDGFESGSLAGWTFTDGGSQLAIASDQALRGSYSVKGVPTSTFNRMVATGVSESNVHVSASMRVAGSANPLDATVGARAQNASTGDEYHLNALDGTWTLARNRLGTWTSLSSVAGTPTLGAWGRVFVRAVGTSIGAGVGTSISLSVTDSQVSAAGSVSLATFAIYSGQNVWFDEVVARKLVAVEPTTALGAALWR